MDQENKYQEELDKAQDTIMKLYLDGIEIMGRSIRRRTIAIVFILVSIVLLPFAIYGIYKLLQ